MQKRNVMTDHANPLATQLRSIAGKACSNLQLELDQFRQLCDRQAAGENKPLAWKRQQKSF